MVRPLGYEGGHRFGQTDIVEGGGNKGMGLIGMRERAALVGGTLQIESQPKAGTTIFARVPAQFVEEEEEREST